VKGNKSASNIFIPNVVKEVEAIELSNREKDWMVVERVQGGEVEAFDALVKKYRQSLFSVVYNMTSNREDASDITQEVFIKAFQSIGRFRGQASFYTWLYRIAVNTSITFVKKSRRQRFVNYEIIDETVVSEEILASLTAKNKTEKGAILSELQEKLNDSLQKLSPKHRIVIILHDIEGMSHKSIAKIIKTSTGTVRSRLHYAKRELQAYLKDYL
tara:strand:+ start:1049 stop:1693 length:645 start_codon:yes stop_codon:yes gene_type:complete